VWFVIPAFNEATVVANVVREVRDAGFLVAVVDDCSTDATATVARDAGAVVVRHSTNLGQGAALQTGIEFAVRRGAAYVVTFDADGQHRLADAEGMLAKAQDESLGVVYGSRFLDDRTDTGTVRRLILRLATWFTRMSTGLKVTDAHNGLRVVRADAAARVNLHQNRMAHATEIVRELAHTGVPWAEYPVHVLYTDYSRGKGQSLWNSVNILVDLVFR
jgi:glycosyltransferase involved in cell wall biosynthesis